MFRFKQYMIWVFLLLAVSCTPGLEEGGALIGVSTQALSSADVAKVTITISGANINPAIIQDLVKTGNPPGYGTHCLPSWCRRCFATRSTAAYPG